MPAADFPLDAPSLTLPDWKGALSRAKKKIPKPPKPPFKVVMEAILLSGGLIFLLLSVLVLLSNPADRPESQMAFQVLFWFVFDIVQWKDFRREYVKWKNEFEEEPKPLPQPPHPMLRLSIFAIWISTYLVAPLLS